MLHAPEKQLGCVLHEFLNELHVDHGPVVFGCASSSISKPSSDVLPVGARRQARSTARQREDLLKRLAMVAARARQVLWLWAIVTVLVLLLAIGLAIYHRDNATFAGVTMLGSSGAIMTLLMQARSIHSRLVATEVLLVMLPNLPVDEWCRVIFALVEEFKGAAIPKQTAQSARRRSTA